MGLLSPVAVHSNTSKTNDAVNAHGGAPALDHRHMASATSRHRPPLGRETNGEANERHDDDEDHQIE